MREYDSDWHEIEAAVERFEDGWSASRTTEIANWLPERPELRLAAIAELVETDLELRIKAGLSARVEDYFEEFPELEQNSERLLTLAKAEMRLRQRREPGLDVAEYHRRFPEAPTRFFAGTISPPVIGDDAGGKRFTLLEPLGEGGLGRVWLAIDHEFGREVAVKEIRSALRNDERSRLRFENEGTITAQLQHPGIISVYARGHFLDGRPYYVMQLIRGVSMQAAIEALHATSAPPRDERKRNLEHRRLLAQFIDACHAIDYAHDEGILHRDIKPANIMLGSFGETVVVDWGLAKRQSQDEPNSGTAPGKPKRIESDSSTKTGQALGSPAYMSPEQAAGQHAKVDRRSDVYSLGATLHTLAFNQPPAPSESSATASSVGSPQTLLLQQFSRAPNGAFVPKALRAICRKCLATDPNDRYVSARALADDVHRFLSDQPVSVHVETAPQQIVRFLKRNRVAMLATAVVMMVLATTWITLAARSDHRKLSDETEAYATLLSEVSLEILSSAEPETAANDPYIRATINRASDISSRLANRPLDQCRILDQVARIHVMLGEFPEAVAAAEASIAAAEIQKRPNDALQNAQLVAQTTLGEAHALQGKLTSAIESLGALHPQLADRFGEDHEATRRCAIVLAKAYNDAAESERSVILLQPIWQVSTPDSPLHWELGNTLAVAHLLAGDMQAAVSLAEAHHESAIEHLPQDDKKLSEVVDTLGLCYTQSGRAAEAVTLHRAAMQRATSVYGDDHLVTLAAKTNLADALLMLKSYDQAVELLSEVFGIQENKLGLNHWATVQTAMSLAEALRNTGTKENAVAALRLNEQTLAIARDSPFAMTRTVAVLSNNLAISYSDAGRYAEAEALYQEAIALIRAKYPKSHPDVLAISRNVARTFRRAGALAQSRELIDTMLEDTRSNYAPTHHTYISTEVAHMHLLVDEGHANQAVQLARKLRQTLQAFNPSSSYAEQLRQRHLTTIERTYRKALLANGDFEQAETEALNHLDSFREKFIPQRKLSAVSELERQLAEALFGQGRLDEAQQLAALAVHRLSFYSFNPEKPDAWTLLGRIETARKEFLAAEEALLQAYFELLGSSDFDAPYYASKYRAAEAALVELYTAWGKAEEAARWKAL